MTVPRDHPLRDRRRRRGADRPRRHRRADRRHTRRGAVQRRQGVRPAGDGDGADGHAVHRRFRAAARSGAGGERRVDVTRPADRSADDSGRRRGRRPWGARYRFYADGTSAPLLTPTALPETANALVTGGLGLVLEPMAAAIEHVVAQTSADVLVLVDLNCRPAAIDDRVAYIARLRHVLARADVIKASDEDVEWLAANGAELLGSDKRVVLVTAGDAGTTIRTSAGSVEVAVEAVPVVDTIGAGDAFTAGFVSWWSASGRGRGDLGDATAIEQAVRAAHEVAAVVVSRRGADPPRREDLPTRLALTVRGRGGRVGRAACTTGRSSERRRRRRPAARCARGARCRGRSRRSRRWRSSRTPTRRGCRPARRP